MQETIRKEYTKHECADSLDDVSTFTMTQTRLKVATVNVTRGIAHQSSTISYTVFEVSLVDVSCVHL